MNIYQCLIYQRRLGLLLILLRFKLLRTFETIEEAGFFIQMECIVPFDIKCGLCFATRDNLAPRFFLYTHTSPPLPYPSQGKAKSDVGMHDRNHHITTALLHLNHGMSQVLK